MGMEHSPTNFTHIPLYCITAAAVTSIYCVLPMSEA